VSKFCAIVALTFESPVAAVGLFGVVADETSEAMLVAMIGSL
jgi:hypothetical protein